MSRALDCRFMALALSLGRRGLGRVWPNPNVGCVIVRDGRILGRGRTADGGRPHAETQALAQASTAARGATAYVTLEPCAHHGQTPPCADALVAAGVARVVVAAQDPDPRVAGRGIERLRAAGIAVETGLMEGEARRDLAGFLNRVERGRPFVTLKLATSLDGRIATGTGESRWITGPEARARVHMMRARHDAVMVGGGTARADDPMLNVRGLGIDRQPVRVVLSRRLDLPLDGALARSAREVPLWLCHGPEADAAPWRALGAESLSCPISAGQLDPAAVLQALGAAGLTRVFCEGGAGLAASLLGAGLVDELVLFTAGCAIGAEGTPALSAMGIGALAEAPRLRLAGQDRVGGDVMSVWRASGG
ncbi:diaminohydroxyphosphoribosylaminopyrimidine deaminase [Limimaricola soesokkakensis]|uniref:Riboflavin biosynthesis protein RibD n=2 Tax=Limimaricola soesokkakensis TaxID=1343159 RepID=A0A1X6Y858_9RHOB|nr:bifunctional diaminohydroxyphosphoribosylaminopyrimidine deaminase/5-amino-6-(5-phosphoribosylamino)uracil reductase RibD [Limimaricola soesokkakensis]PSK87263.1 diaminohydroxyphosphoribosylaminopyrimidine deaminase [Limimaricola soesokkakensis]SLN13128.1 Riboflavin biosynthesis protein RibD [Limimaricola soesokkakensis]